MEWWTVVAILMDSQVTFREILRGTVIAMGIVV